MTHSTRSSRLRSSVSVAAAVLLGTAGLAAPAVAAPEPATTPDTATTEPVDAQSVGSEEATEDTPVEQQAADEGAADATESAQAANEPAVEVQQLQVAGDTVIDIAAISDFHGAIRTAPYIAGLLDAKRAENANFDFVSVGDSIGGSAFESAIAKDVPTIKTLNAMGLEVSAVGNHEFDVSYADLRDRVLPLADFPYLGANVDGAPEINTPPYHTVTHGDVTVAYIGTVTDLTPTLTSASAVAGLTFTDPVAKTNEIAAQLKDGNPDNGEADVVVALMHEGSGIVATLGSDVDLAFGGHTHVAASTTTASGAAVCQPAASGATVSFATVTVAADGTVSSTCENTDVDTENGPVNTEIQALVDGFLAESEVLGAEELFAIDGVANRGTNTGPGDEGANRGTESSAGNLIAQAFYEYGQTLAAPADFGIMNSGGIRADFDPNADGTVTFKESFDVQPFGNSYGTRVITGADIYELLEQQWKPGQSRPILRLGLSDNVKYVYDPTAAYGEHVLAVYIDGELVAEDTTEYTVASSSFLLDAGDGFTALANAGNPVIDTGIIDHQVFNIVAQGWAATDGAVTPDYTQRSFGYAGPTDLIAGSQVSVDLASLVMTSSEPKPKTVTVSIGGTDLATADIDPTITPALDDSGKATVTFTVPADASGPITITADDGSTIDVPVNYVNGEMSLTVAAISDYHGAIRTAPYMAYMLDQLRANNDKVHFVSVGDNVGGSTFESAIAQDVPTIEVLNAMGMLVTAVGNHEFDVSYADLRDRIIPLADFAHLGANVEGAPEINTPPYRIYYVDGVRVAYVGAVTSDTPNLTSASAVGGLTFADPVAVTNEIAAQLKDGNQSNGEADVVIALMHEGSGIVATLGDDVDLAFGGHTHVAAVTQTASGAPVCQPAASGETLAVATITRDAAGEISASCTNETVPTEEDGANVNAEIQALVDGFLAESEVLGAEELFAIDGVANRGTNTGPGDEGANRGTESSAGNLIAQAFYEYGQTLAAPADFGIMNSGGIRADFDPNADGTVTFKESFDVQPFGNSYGTRVITGADVYELLEQQWKPGQSRPILRLGLSDNVKYVYDPAAEYGEHILAVYIDGELVAEDATEYTVASSSFLLDAGDGFTALANAGNPVVDTGIIDHQVFNIVAQGWAETDGAVNPDYTQRSFGYTGPATVSPGEEVTIELASLVMTSSEPKPETVTVSVGGTDLATADIDPTITPTLDDSGKATVTFTVPAGATGPLTITTSDGSTIDIPVTVPYTCEVMTPPERLAGASDRFGEATGDAYADVWAVNGAGELHFYEGYNSGIYHAGIVDCGFVGTSLTKVSDVNGDNRADFVVRHGDGGMFFYYSTGDGFLQQGKRIGHGWNGMDNIIYAGTLGAGSTEYVIARQVATGDLYRYTLTSNGLTATTKIGHGWSGMDYILSVGHIVDDGYGDLIGITTDGKMIAYKGHRDGTISTHGQIGHGWSAFVDAFVPGDLTGDGRLDLIGVRGDGKMFLYENTGRGYFKTAQQIGHGWSAMEIMN